MDEEIIERSIFHSKKDEIFTISKLKCCISIRPKNRLEMDYTLTVNDKSLDAYIANWKSITDVWKTHIDGIPTRIVLGEQLNPIVLLIFSDHQIIYKDGAGILNGAQYWMKNNDCFMDH